MTLPLRSRPIPTSEPADFGRVRRRTTIVRASLALALLAVFALAFLEARSIDPRHAPLVPSGTTGMLVLDLSASVYEDAIGQTIRKLVAQGEETGVVAFSDAGYELLPPGTNSRELLPLLRFFNPETANTTGLLPVDPWQDFRAGTRISEGLKVAHEALERERVTKGSIVLVSDLEILPDEVVRLGDVAADLQGAGIRLRIVPLFPTPGEVRADPADRRRLVVPARVVRGVARRGARGAEPRARGAVGVPGDRRAPRPAAGRERGCALASGGAAMRWRGWAVKVAAVLRRAGRDRCSRSSPSRSCACRASSPPTTSASRRRRGSSATSGTISASCPGEPGVRLLGARDDVTSRETDALFALVDPAKVAIRTPEQEALRGRAQLEVTLRAQEAAEARVRSRHLNLLGVLTMSRFSTSGPEATQLLSRAVGAFQTAIEIDPTNLDAKKNLEILLRRPEAAMLPPNNPFQGGAQGRFSGQGRAGSGY